MAEQNFSKILIFGLGGIALLMFIKQNKYDINNLFKSSYSSKSQNPVPIANQPIEERKAELQYKSQMGDDSATKELKDLYDENLVVQPSVV